MEESNTTAWAAAGLAAGVGGRCEKRVIHPCSHAFAAKSYNFAPLPPRGSAAVAWATQSLQSLTTPVREQLGGVGSTSFHCCSGPKGGLMGTCDGCFVGDPKGTLRIFLT